MKKLGNTVTAISVALVGSACTLNDTQDIGNGGVTQTPFIITATPEASSTVTPLDVQDNPVTIELSTKDLVANQYWIDAVSFVNDSKSKGEVYDLDFREIQNINEVSIRIISGMLVITMVDQDGSLRTGIVDSDLFAATFENSVLPDFLGVQVFQVGSGAVYNTTIDNTTFKVEFNTDGSVYLQADNLETEESFGRLLYSPKN